MNISHHLLFIFSLSFLLLSQENDSISVSEQKTVIYDLETEKEIQEFDSNSIKEYKNQDEFNYVEVKEQDNWWTQFKNWFNQLIRRFFGWLSGGEINGFWSLVLQILPYLLVIAVLALLGWLFLKVNPSDMLMEKQDPPQIALTEDEDIIQNQDIQHLIQQALLNNNYRLAIRYYYLLVLKKLSDKEFINWEPQKTNTDYSRELKDNALNSRFKIITRLYDYIWYGNFEVNELSFRKAEKEFQQLINQIQN